jgi:hypothetical protein
MTWGLSHRFDPKACLIADRHYNRRKPGSPQFVPPGRCLVLLTKDAGALWVTSWPFAEYVRHRWPGAWINSLFRRETGPKSSELIRQAIAATRWYWPDVPSLGMVTFVDSDKVRSRRAGYGKCYIKAGFEPDGETEGGLLAFRMRPDAMPEPEEPIGAQLSLITAAREYPAALPAAVPG